MGVIITPGATDRLIKGILVPMGSHAKARMKRGKKTKKEGEDAEVTKRKRIRKYINRKKI